MLVRAQWTCILNNLFDADHDDCNDDDDTHIVLFKICTAYECQNIQP